MKQAVRFKKALNGRIAQSDRHSGESRNPGITCLHKYLDSGSRSPGGSLVRNDVLYRGLLTGISRGFTLIEVLVVVVILSILAALIVPKIMDRPDEARVVAAKSDIRAITSALKLYRLDNGVYPSTEQGLQSLVKKPETGEVPRNWKGSGYLDRLPKDPWKNEYQYLNPGLHGDIDIFSLGADGQPGGEGVNTEIGTWNLDQ